LISGLFAALADVDFLSNNFKKDGFASTSLAMAVKTSSSRKLVFADVSKNFSWY
jgi:hypothetical protein